MESTGSQKTAEEMFKVSTQENVFKNTYSILLSATGLLQPHGPHVLSSKMSHAESSRNSTTRKTLAKSGTISQIMCLTSNGDILNWQKIRAFKSQTKESGLQEMTQTPNIRATARKFPGLLISTCTCQMTTSLLHLRWLWSRATPSSRHRSTCSSLALHKTRYVSLSIPRLSGLASLT